MSVRVGQSVLVCRVTAGVCFVWWCVWVETVCAWVRLTRLGTCGVEGFGWERWDVCFEVWVICVRFRCGGGFGVHGGRMDGTCASCGGVPLGCGGPGFESRRGQCIFHSGFQVFIMVGLR